MTKSTVLGAFPGIDAKVGTKKRKFFMLYWFTSATEYV